MAMIYLIRHGQANFFKSDYDKLTDLGIQQSKLVGRALKERQFHFTSVHSGTLNRHQETSKYCLNEFGLNAEIKYSGHWNEYDHKELLSKYNPEYSDFSKLSNHIRSHPSPLKALQDILNQSILDWMENKHAYSISWKSFKENIWGELENAATKLSSRDNAVVFTSGGPISVIVMIALGLKESAFIDIQNRIINTSITKILVGKSGLSVSTYNDYSHLEHDFGLVSYR
ncbi:histidine phosphatase family protein [Fulvivirga lutea]|uniref:Histidine phosphatase family protein n=1 Tax=Fulvivirga lutea TaxID=2810512 RepID=A0A974WI58_9BACT|nr:histidine phosphatase family protein [Fulvivirga lutea]QSE97592.1 histidine phosphatase family protein [Fulvivirga lutea]